MSATAASGDGGVESLSYERTRRRPQAEVPQRIGEAEEGGAVVGVVAEEAAVAGVLQEGRARPLLGDGRSALPAAGVEDPLERGRLALEPLRALAPRTPRHGGPGSPSEAASRRDPRAPPPGPPGGPAPAGSGPPGRPPAPRGPGRAAPARHPPPRRRASAASAMDAKARAQESATSRVRWWNVQCSNPSKTPYLARRTGNLDRNRTGDQACAGVWGRLPGPLGPEMAKAPQEPGPSGRRLPPSPIGNFEGNASADPTRRKSHDLGSHARGRTGALWWR